MQITAHTHPPPPLLFLTPSRSSSGTASQRGRGPTHSAPLSLEIKLSMTLRCLAGGHHFDIIDLHGVKSKQTLYTVLLETLQALDEILEWPNLMGDQDLWSATSIGFAAKSGMVLTGCRDTSNEILFSARCLTFSR